MESAYFTKASIYISMNNNIDNINRSGTDKNFDTEKESYYLTRLAKYPSIFSDDKKTIEIGNNRVERYPLYNDTGDEIIGHQDVKITGNNLLRSNDDEVFYAIVQAHISHGALDNINFEEVSKMHKEGGDLSSFINSIRTVETSLAEIARILGKPVRADYLERIADSLLELSAIELTSKKVYLKDCDQNHSVETINKKLIGEYSLSKQDLKKAGFIELSKSVCEDLLLGKILRMDIDAYINTPTGKGRKFFRYLHWIFQKSDRHDMDMYDLFFNILGTESKDRDAAKDFKNCDQYTKTRLNKTYSKFKTDICEGFVYQNILESGFELDSKRRTYELLYESDDGKKMISLRKGPWFYDKAKNPIPTANTRERQRTLEKLLNLGLNNNILSVYTKAVSNIPIHEEENVNNRGKDTKVFTSYKNGFSILITPKNGEAYVKNIELDWDLLDKYIHYSELYKKYHPNGPNYPTVAVILRNVIEKGVYNDHDYEILKLKEAAKNKKNKISDPAVEKEAQQAEQAEQENKEREARRQKDVDLEFIKLSSSYHADLATYMSFRNAVDKACPEAIRESWFGKSESPNYTLLIIENALVMYSNCRMTSDWINRQFKDKIDHYLFNNNTFKLNKTHVFGSKEDVIEYIKDFGIGQDKFPADDKPLKEKGQSFSIKSIPSYYKDYSANANLSSKLIRMICDQKELGMTDSDQKKLSEFLKNPDVPHRDESLKWLILGHANIEE